MAGLLDTGCHRPQGQHELLKLWQCILDLLLEADERLSENDNVSGYMLRDA